MDVEWEIVAGEYDAYTYDITANDESFPICGKKYPWCAMKKYTRSPWKKKFSHCRKCYRRIHALAAEAKLAQLQSS